jgi:Flp pilus assembly protein TadD
MIRACALPRPGARQWIWLSGSLLLFVLALLTKETAIVEPVLVAAYLLFFRPLFFRPQNSRQRFPFGVVGIFLLVAMGYLFARYSVLGSLGHSYLRMSFADALLTVPSVLWFYLKHLLWPAGLSIIYDAPPPVHLGWWNFWWPLLALASVTVALAAYLVRTRDRVAAFGTLLLLLPLLPVLYVPALEPGNFLHDRYLYLPSIGFAILIASLLRRMEFGRARVFGMPAVQAAIALVLLLGGAAATASQQVFWANDVLLFSRATEIAPANETAFTNLGTALAVRGHRKQARFAFEQVIRRNPNSWRAQYDLGLSYFLDGKYPEAEVYLQKAIELNPLEGDPAAALAESRLRQGKFATAEPAILQAIAVKPYQPGFRRVLALSLEGQGKLREAVQAAEAELARNPGDLETRSLLDRLRRESVPK